jgi:hypothetical protein
MLDILNNNTMDISCDTPRNKTTLLNPNYAPNKKKCEHNININEIPPMLPLLRCVATCYCNCNISYGLCLNPDPGQLLCSRCLIYCNTTISTGIKRKYDQ